LTTCYTLFFCPFCKEERIERSKKSKEWIDLGDDAQSHQSKELNDDFSDLDDDARSQQSKNFELNDDFSDLDDNSDDNSVCSDWMMNDTSFLYNEEHKFLLELNKN